MEPFDLSFVTASVNGVILLHKVHGVNIEEAHVLADEEGDVAYAVFVVEHEGLLHLL